MNVYAKWEEKIVQNKSEKNVNEFTWKHSSAHTKKPMKIDPYSIAQSSLSIAKRKKDFERK